MSFQETAKFINMILNIEQNIASQPYFTYSGTKWSSSTNFTVTRIA